MLKKILYGIVFVALVIGFWNLFEFVYTSLITKSGYEFTWSDCVIMPLSVGVIMYLIVFVFEIIKSKKK